MSQTEKKRILVTGATGFVGKHLCEHLEGCGHTVVRIGRSGTPSIDLARENIPNDLLTDVDVVVHLAASKAGSAVDPKGEQTKDIAARVAVSVNRSEVKRLIHLSSIAARLAEENDRSKRPYGVQKLAAEHALADGLNNCQIVTLRPPVIYGEGATGPFGTLLKFVQRGLPLPLANASEPRTYLSIVNLCALLSQMVEAGDPVWKKADGLIFEPNDGRKVGTRDLAEMLGKSMEIETRVFWLPQSVIRSLGLITGKGDQVAAVFGPLQCREEPSLEEYFGWEPSEQMPESLKVFGL